MKTAILILMLVAGVAACSVDESESSSTSAIRGGECWYSDATTCQCGTPGCDGDPPVGGGAGGGGGGGGGGDPYTRTTVCGAIYQDVCTRPDGTLYSGNYRRCCDYSTLGTPLGCSSWLVTPCGDAPL